MADVKDEPTATKKAGHASIKFLMLTASNYTVWCMRIKITLKFSEVWETIDPGTKDEKQNKLMYVDSGQESYGGYGRGRGRGGRSPWRGRGRGRQGSSFQNQREAYKRRLNGDTSHITCICCDKLGHYASDCLNKQLKLQETVEKKEEDTHDADELMMNEVVYLNERKVNPSTFEADLDTMNIWYLDNGASNHMSGNRLFFNELDETILGKVKFGDDSRIDIRGKGLVRFIFKGGEKKILRNVNYIPGLRSNIISLGQATEVGCEVRMKDDTLTLLDRNRRLMVKTTRSKNRLYKVVLHADQAQCLLASSASGSSIWHDHLGHINAEKLKMRVNMELVSGVPKTSGGEERCVSCLLGKQTRRPFPQATLFRASKTLDLSSMSKDHGTCDVVGEHSQRNEML